MNTKIKLLIWLFFLTLFFTFSSCEKDLYEEPIQEQTQQNIDEKTEGKINYVTIDDVPFLKPSIKKFQAKNKLTAKGIANSELDLEHIIEYKGADNYKSYSIAIDEEPTENGDYYFENLNVIKNGDKYETFILRYNPDNDTQLLDFSNFTGRTEFFTNEDKPVGSITFQNSTARRVQQAIKAPSEDTGGGGGCGCGPSMIENLFNWIRNAIKNVSYAISGINITAYSNAGNNGYNYNPYVLTVTPINMGTSTNPNSIDPSSGNSTIVVSPNEPIWSATTSQKVMAQRLSRRIDFNDSKIYTWLLDPKNAEITKNSHFILWEDNTFENREFVKQAIVSLKAGGEVDFGYRVIIDPSLKNNPCLFGVYTKMGGVGTFQKYIEKFDSKFSVMDLKISVDDKFGTNHKDFLASQAITTIPVNKTINIIFNNDPNLPGNIMKFPQISIATNFMHEIIHAEINRQLSTASTDTNINPQKMSDSEWKSYINNIKNDFPQMFKYYSNYVLKTATPSDFQHQYMADKYRGVIKEAMKQYDGNQHNEDYYDALSWNGLKNTVAWNKLSGTEKTKILQTIQTIYKNGTYCN